MEYVPKYMAVVENMLSRSDIMDSDKKIIIVEGPQGVGKTTVTNWIRERLPYTNLYRLSGHDVPDMNGFNKSILLYDSLMDHIESINTGSIMNILMDRSFISEYVYCELGYRKYDFCEPFYKYIRQLDNMNNVIILNLYLSDNEIYRHRLMRDKPMHCNIGFDVDNSINQQNVYRDTMMMISMTYGNIQVHDIMMDNGDWMQQIKDAVEITLNGQ